MGNCGNCNSGSCDSPCDDCHCDSSDYIGGYSVFDRRENEVDVEDIDCKFKLGDKVYNPNTFEYGIVDGYRKMLGSLFVCFKITSVNSSSKLFSINNKGKVYLVEPCFLEIVDEE